MKENNDIDDIFEMDASKYKKATERRAGVSIYKKDIKPRDIK
jgi:hypothetical protein